jgi:hypothetical protein
MASLDHLFVAEIWEVLVSSIANKEKLDAAEALIKLCDEYGFTTEDFSDIIETSKILDTAYNRYFADNEDDDAAWDE